MHPGIFFGLSLFSGIFLFAGSGAHMFLLYSIGLTGMGTFILLTGITIPRKPDWINKSFKTNKNFPSVILSGVVTLLGIVTLYNSIDYWRDLPYYRNKDYNILSGIPTSVEEYTTTKGGGTDIYVVINGKTFVLFEPGPKDHSDDPEKLRNKHFTFYYLPHSEWVIDYTLK